VRLPGTRFGLRLGRRRLGRRLGWRRARCRGVGLRRLDFGRLDPMGDRVEVLERRPEAPEHARERVTLVGREQLRPARGQLNAGNLIVATTNPDALRIALVPTLFPRCAALRLTCVHVGQTVAYQGGHARRV
jgi:hypothetical protein